MVFFLALRNITRNKRNSVIVALLIAIITFIFFIGNSTIGRADTSIRGAFVDSLTGDVVIGKTEDVTMNLFGANVPSIDEYFTIPVLPAQDVLMELVSAEKGIAGITRQVSGAAFLDFLSLREQARVLEQAILSEIDEEILSLFPDLRDPAFISEIDDAVYFTVFPVFREPVLLCGIDAETYFSLFPGIVLEEGVFLAPGEYGAMITTGRARRIEERTGQRPAAGDPLLLTSGGKMGFKIREIPLVGIFSYDNPGLFMEEIVLADPQTVRVLNSIQVADGADIDHTEETLWLMSADLDDIFGSPLSLDNEIDGDMFSQPFFPETGFSAEEFSEAEFSAEEFSAELLRAFLSEPVTEEDLRETGGDWNFILIRLEKGVSASSFISSLNRKIERLGVNAVNWRTAAGTSAILMLLIQALFNAGIFLVSVAGAIAAINIHLISVFRRTREIGTLRAIGASNTYIRSLIFIENLLTALIAGIAGVLGGHVFSRWINGMSLRIPNDIIASILGGPVLRIELLPEVALFSLFMALMLGLVASLYPVEAAVRIEPMAAVRRG